MARSPPLIRMAGFPKRGRLIGLLSDPLECPADLGHRGGFRGTASAPRKSGMPWVVDTPVPASTGTGTGRSAKQATRTATFHGSRGAVSVVSVQSVARWRFGWLRPERLAGDLLVRL